MGSRRGASCAIDGFVTNMQKKLMLLGGIRYLLPVIEAAHKMGVYVITADKSA